MIARVAFSGAAFRKKAQATVLVLVAGSSLLQAAEWSQFLGPDRNGIAPESPKLARRWPVTGPPVVWKVSLGVGFGGPAIRDGRVLMLDREKGVRDILRCLDFKTGQELWRHAYDAPGTLSFPGSRSTPASDGKLVYSIGPFGHILAVTLAEGRPVWQSHMVQDWQAKRPHWGFSQSPLILGDLLIVAPWGRKAAVAAYDKATGKVRWTTPNPEQIGQDYSSPVAMTLNGRRMVVAGGRKGRTIGVDSETGEKLWDFAGYSCRLHIPTPTILGDGRILLTGGYKAGSVMFKVELRDGRYATRVLWEGKTLGSKIPQPLVYEGHIYANSSDNGAGLACFTLGGKEIWRTGRNPWFDMGDVLIAGGLLFAVNGKNGQLVMVRPAPDGYHELGRASLLRGPQVWAPMAFADGLLLLRDQHTMLCVDLRQK
ncbi:MAG: PQQ-binding-like beta-propeller repeat protein [Kiritimatiellaeota bacterium]|nr:PQQ-binding-like beta-propeller repeat protein [Kiritimatiellota bacterium]